MSEALEKAARATREEIVRQYRDDERRKCPGGAPFYEEEVAPSLIARAAITAFLSDLRATSEVELCRIADAYNASEPDFLVDEDELRWALSALMLHVADKKAHHGE